MKILSPEQKSKLHSFWGQLIDLKCGHLDELVIINGENADLLGQVIRDRLALEKKIGEDKEIKDRIEKLEKE